MNKIRKLLRYTKGYERLYLGAFLAVLTATFFALLNPMVIRYTIDYVLPTIMGKTVTAQEGAQGLDKMISAFLDMATNRNVWIAASLLLGFTIFRGIALFFKGKWAAQASEGIARSIRNAVYMRLQTAPYGWYGQQETGDLIQRSTSDVDTLRRFLAMQLVELVNIIFMTTVILAFMITMSPRLTIVSLSIMPIVFIASFVFFTKVKKVFKDSDEAEGRMSTVLQENINGVRVVRAFAREKFEIDKFENVNRAYSDITYGLIRLFAFFWSLTDLLCYTQLAMALIFGIIWSVQGLVTVGTVVAFITYVGMLSWPIRNMGRILSDFGKSVVSLERIEEILDAPSDLTEEDKQTPDIHGGIVFDNVSFTYGETSPILNDVSFEIEAGETIGILGPTGSGKSTLVNLLSRLYDYEQGSIRIDGVELKDIDKQWIRKHVGLILQEPFLFAKTIKENIAIATPEADEKDVYQAAESACIHHNVLQFDKGYETLVGEKGVSLSGGQKQRMAIARTIIGNRPILVFDDSLSAVDTETDRKIRRELNRLGGKRTTLIISHRISTLKEADRILVIEDGHVTAFDKHEVLIEKPGLYKRIWDIQSMQADAM